MTTQSQDVLDPQAGFASSAIGMRSDAPGQWLRDPLDPDSPDDGTVVTSPRRLIRLAIAAADAGGRFARDGLAEDAVAWLLTPRNVFDGRRGIEACQDLHHFTRSIVLHGVGLGLDADADEIDGLLETEGGERGGYDGRGFPVPGERGEATRGPSEGGGYGLHSGLGEGGDNGSHRLLSCWVDASIGTDRLFAFCALVTDRPQDIVERVVGRYGVSIAAEARYVDGYDHTTAFATAMISDAMGDTLALAARDPGSPLARGLDVFIEQRFSDVGLAE